MMLQEMLALRPAPPSATHSHLHTHSHICISTYIYIHISLSLSICRGGRTSCNARVSKASIVSTHQTANAMHTLLHHVKRALFLFSFFVLFRRIVPTTTWMGGEKQGTPQETNSREYIESSHQQVFCRIFFDSYPYYLDFFFSHSRSIIIVIIVIIIILPVTSCIGNSAVFSIESLFAH